MRRHLPLLAAALLGVCAFLAFRHGTLVLGRLEKSGETASVVCGSEVSAGEAWRILEQKGEDAGEEQLQMVFWKEQEDVEAESFLTGRSAHLRIICAAGDTELLFPEGNVLAAGDTEGCLVDEKTAGELFGFGSVIGQKLTLMGKEYEIRGILGGQNGVAVVQKTEETAFDTVTVKSGKRHPGEVRELLEGRYGIRGTLEEWELLYGMAMLLLCLFPGAVLAAVLVKIRRNRRESCGRGEKLFWSLCFWLGILGGLWGILRQLPLSSDMIPSTWSDFDFWVNLWEEKTAAAAFLSGMKKRVPEMVYIRAFYQCVIWGFLSLLLYFLALICYTYKDRLPSGYEQKSEA